MGPRSRPPTSGKSSSTCPASASTSGSPRPRDTGATRAASPSSSSSCAAGAAWRPPPRRTALPRVERPAAAAPPPPALPVRWNVVNAFPAGLERAAAGATGAASSSPAVESGCDWGAVSYRDGLAARPGGGAPNSTASTSTVFRTAGQRQAGESRWAQLGRRHVPGRGGGTCEPLRSRRPWAASKCRAMSTTALTLLSWSTSVQHQATATGGGEAPKRRGSAQKGGSQHRGLLL